MPTKARRENRIIRHFLSAYENRTWADAEIDWRDERLDGAVEAVAIRRADGTTLAIEHTLIQPFDREREDFAYFRSSFLEIEEDADLHVRDRWIQLFVPVGILFGQHRKSARFVIVDAVHNWLKLNRIMLPLGESQHALSIPNSDGGLLNATLTVRVAVVPGAGKLHVRRQQLDDNLPTVIEKAIVTKVRKLAATNAVKRILMLERQHMNLYPARIAAEIENRRPEFPELATVDEIWIVETIFYESDAYIHFELYKSGRLVESLDPTASKLGIAV